MLDGLTRKKELLPKLEAIRKSDPKNVFLGYFLRSSIWRPSSGTRPNRSTRTCSNGRPRSKPIAGWSASTDQHAADRGAVGYTGRGGRKHRRPGRFSTRKSRGSPGQRIAHVADPRRPAAAASGPRRLRHAAERGAARVGGEAIQFRDEFFDLALASRPKAAAELLLTWGSGYSVLSRCAGSRTDFPARHRSAQFVPADNPLFYSYLAVALEMSGKTDAALTAARRHPSLGKIPRGWKAAWRGCWYHAKRYPEAAGGYRELIEVRRRVQGRETSAAR